MRVIVVLLAVIGLSEASYADTFYVASLNGAQAMPPTGSTATGFARIMLNESETQIRFSLHYAGVLTNITGAHVHGPSSNIALPLPPAGPSGELRNLGYTVEADNVADLKAGLFYVEIHTESFPGGEIRGQLRVDPVLTTSLSGTQMVPPTGSAATGRGFVSLNAAETQALVTVRWSGLGSSAIEARLQSARSGLNGPIICPLTPLIGATTGSVVDALCPLTPTQVADLKAGGMYLLVRSASLTSGEIRGQIKRSFSPCDFDRDGKSDQVVVRNTGGGVDWWIRQSGGGIQTFTWGLSGDIARIICPDVDGDGRADATIWRTGAAGVFWSRLSTGGIRAQTWGTTADNPRATGDYDGDGRDDYAIFRPNPAGSSYWILQSATGTVRAETWGASPDFLQVLPDYDGDGKTDLGVQRMGGQFWRKLSTGGIDTVFWGTGDEGEQSADYDGDGRTDIAVVRLVSTSYQWWIRGSLTGGAVSPYGSGFFFGTGSHLPATADYDGDRLADVAIWAPDSGVWWIQSVKTGLTLVAWGAPGDFPVHRAYWH